MSDSQRRAQFMKSGRVQQARFGSNQRRPAVRQVVVRRAERNQQHDWIRQVLQPLT